MDHIEARVAKLEAMIEKLLIQPKPSKNPKSTEKDYIHANCSGRVVARC